MKEFIKQQQELARETARSIEGRLVHKLQVETTSTKGQSTEYRKGLRDMRYLVMEHARELAEIDLDTLITQIITNTGAEIMRRVEGERKKKNSIKHFSGNGYYNQQGHNQALDTIKQHIKDVIE